MISHESDILTDVPLTGELDVCVNLEEIGLAERNAHTYLQVDRKVKHMDGN